MSRFESFLSEAAHVKPSPRQMDWMDMEFYGFVHYSPNTYTNLEWGLGNEPESIFRPTDLDCDQWAEAFAHAGMKGMILTAKHHDGFCLWPSRYTEHSVKNSPGCPDVVKEASEACRRHGLKFGVYLSPWDRNSRFYGTDAYNDYYCHQLEELLTGYGPLFCVWFDNACGEGPNGKKQVYDFPRYIALIRKLQPQAVIFNDYGPDVRWIGNEAGRSRHAEWAVVPSELCRYADVQTGPGPLRGDLSYMYNPDPDIGTLHNILYSKGLCFCPAETDMSIRPGWFYHENEQPHSLERLFSTYLNTAGANSCLNLNVPPSPCGKFDEKDVKRLHELGEQIRRSFARNIAGEARKSVTAVSETQQTITLRLPRTEHITFVDLKEDIAQGQRIENFQILADEKNGPSVVYQGTVVGHRKICELIGRGTVLEPEGIDTGELTIRITASREKPLIRSIGIYTS